MRLNDDELLLELQYLGFVGLLGLLENSLALFTVLLKSSLHGLNQTCVLLSPLRLYLILQIRCIANNGQCVDDVADNWVRVFKFWMLSR